MFDGKKKGPLAEKEALARARSPLFYMIFLSVDLDVVRRVRALVHVVASVALGAVL